MNDSQKHWSNIRQAMQELVHGWIYDPNVMYIDYGWRERKGTLLKDELCVRVHVRDKIESGTALEIAIQKGVTNERIPRKIHDLPVDVQERSYWLHQPWPYYPQQGNQRTSRHTPMRGGISISNAYLWGSGTLGGQVTDRKTGKKMILSNWHVLAGQWHAQAGWPIYQPGRGDGGTVADTVARLSRHGMDVNLDAAVAELVGERDIINDQYKLGMVTGSGWAQLGMAVIKSGRTTDVTYGSVSGVEGTLKIVYSGVPRRIESVITITPRLGKEVSAGGDSGSFWLDEESMKAVGLHFAGSNYPEQALAIDMPPVLDALNITIP